MRSSVVILSLAAWFALSNHCALGALVSPIESLSPATGCPMHSAPVKKLPPAKGPCCKDVRAVIAKWVGANPGFLRMAALQDYPALIFAEPIRVSTGFPGADTGPPDCLSFAESVLQESMLSHAPPVS